MKKKKKEKNKEYSIKVYVGIGLVLQKEAYSSQQSYSPTGHGTLGILGATQMFTHRLPQSII